MALVLVTGASSGIGLLAARGLAAAGHDVVVHARTADRLPVDLARAGELVGDLADADAVADVAAGAQRFGRFDAVIHNAGVIDGPDGLAHAVDPGWVPTRMGGSHAPDDLREGSRTQQWLATAPAEEISPRTGGYWFHRRIQEPHPAATDPTFQRDLIALLAAQTGVALD